MIEYIDTYNTLKEKHISNLELINIGFEQCKPKYSYGPHIRPYHLIHFVTSGSGFLLMNNITYKVNANDAFIIPAETISFYEADSKDPWEYYWIGFTGTQANSLTHNMINSLQDHYIIRNIDTHLYAKEIKYGASLDKTDITNHLLSTSILYKICSLLSKDVLTNTVHTKTSSVSENIKFYLDAKYTEKISLMKLAENFHVHPNYLTRIFKETYGISPKQYLLDLKMNKATQLLSTTDMPINIISSSVGYDDQLSFSKAFHERYGKSPSQFREENCSQI